MRNGFTIIEIIIAIFVSGIALAGIFGAFSVATILASDSVNRITATYLAQEGMEIVRNIRDTNWLRMDALGCENSADCEGQATWLDYIDPAICSSGCKADFSSTELFAHSPGEYLYIDANGFYGYYQSNASKTEFQRRIKINRVLDTDGKDDHIINVTVEISWDQKATLLNPFITADICSDYNCIKTEEILYNWYNYINH